MLWIQLPEDIEARLQHLAKQTGRSKSSYAREAIVEKIEDMEDIYLAEKSAGARSQGRGRNHQRGRHVA